MEIQKLSPEEGRMNSQSTVPRWWAHIIIRLLEATKCTMPQENMTSLWWCHANVAMTSPLWRGLGLGRLCIGGGDGDTWEISAPSSQFFCELKTALKIKCLKIYKHIWGCWRCHHFELCRLAFVHFWTLTIWLYTPIWELLVWVYSISFPNSPFLPVCLQKNTFVSLQQNGKWQNIVSHNSQRRANPGSIAGTSVTPFCLEAKSMFLSLTFRIWPNWSFPCLPTPDSVLFDTSFSIQAQPIYCHLSKAPHSSMASTCNLAHPDTSWHFSKCCAESDYLPIRPSPPQDWLFTDQSFWLFMIHACHITGVQ
jgi:hypothetical protein